MPDPIMTQSTLVFDHGVLPDHPIVILRCRGDHVEARWPELGLRARFRDWPAALERALHPLNAHVCVKVRP